MDFVQLGNVSTPILELDLWLSVLASSAFPLCFRLCLGSLPISPYQIRQKIQDGMARYGSSIQETRTCHHLTLVMFSGPGVSFG